MTNRQHMATPRAAALLLAVAAVPAPAAEPDARTQTLPEVQVVGTVPLPGIGIPLNQVPANVQSLSSEQLSRQSGENVPDFLNLNLGSVNINDTQGNPFQPDVNFRGFSASPVLGTPNGVSVFVDGVRTNESFGDTVNWDLIPRAAIAGITALPGSNPVFGLNTLGGALAITTKNGFQYPGTVVRVNAGSFSRQSYQFESGDHGTRADYFVTGSYYNDNGWGAHNPSRVNQWFGQTGYQGERTRLNASMTYGDTRLAGNQTLPLSMFGDPSQAYTYPDTTANRLGLLNLRAEHTLSATSQINAQTYYRSVRTRAVNSNINNNFDTTLPPAPGNEPASNVFNNTNDNRYGATLQYTGTGEIAGRKATLTTGVSYDRSSVEFQQFNQEAPVQPDRNTVSDLPSALQTNLRAITRTYGVYATDTIALNDQLHLTASGRYNYATIELKDQFGTALNGDHRFMRFNPALGLTWNPRPVLTVYGAYNEGMRIPTPVELSCADPTRRARYPTRSPPTRRCKRSSRRTWEAGARGRLSTIPRGAPRCSAPS